MVFAKGPGKLGKGVRKGGQEKKDTVLSKIRKGVVGWGGQGALLGRQLINPVPHHHPFN